MLQLVNLLAAGVPAPGRAALPTCRPDPAYACDSRAFANGTEVCYFLPAVAEPAKPQCGCPKVRPHCAKDGTTDKGAVASRTADGEFLAGVGKRGNLAPAHGLPSPHKYDDAVRV